MDKCVTLILSCAILSTSAWSPYHPAPRAPARVVRYAPAPHRAPPRYQTPVYEVNEPVRAVSHEPIRALHEPTAGRDPPQWQRPKRGHDHDYDSDHRGSSGVTGPVHTFVKTDKNANYKWGVRHHVGDKFSS